MFLKCTEKQSRCGNQKGMRLWDYEERLTPGLILLSSCSSNTSRGCAAVVFFPDVGDITAIARFLFRSVSVVLDQ